MDGSGLLPNIAAALGLALAGGFIARLLRIPSIVGYLAAGLAISPFTPGWDADLDTLQQVAEIGVIFLMFGIGLNFDLKHLIAVRGVVLPGAIAVNSILIAGVLAATMLLGLTWKEGLVVGLAIIVSSSAVLGRALIDHGLTESIPGRIAIGWSVVEDLSTVLILALLPMLASGGGNALRDGAWDLGKAAVFLVVMLVAGPRVIPFVLRRVALLGSRELFILAVVTLALGIATAGSIAFGVTIAIGAFVAGVAISETEMGHQATADVIPLREAFAVLFFVSVGMLVDPGDVIDNLDILAVVVVAGIFGKALLVIGFFAFYAYTGRTALYVSAGVAQFAEFSFLISGAALAEGIIDPGLYNVLLAGSAVSVAVNPVLYLLAPRFERFLRGTGPLWRRLDAQGLTPTPHVPSGGHVVILGYGRVGELIGHALNSLERPFVIIEGDLQRARRLRAAGQPVIWGDAANGEALTEASLHTAILLVAALPDENSTVLSVSNARRLAPHVPIVARARTREEVAILQRLGVSEVVVPEYEGGLELMSQTLNLLGFPLEEAEALRLSVRDIHYGDAYTAAHV